MHINDLDYLQYAGCKMDVVGGMGPDFDAARENFNRRIESIRLGFNTSTSSFSSSFEELSSSFPDSVDGGGFTRPSFTRTRISRTIIGREIVEVAPTE